MNGIQSERGCKCKQHEFILKPLNQNLHYSRKVQVSLCESVSKNLRKKISTCRRKCWRGYPILNTDKNYATPAFILQSQKQHFLENRNIYLKDHSRKTRQYEQIATDIYFPAPRSNNDYCNVCCASYSNHIQHISSAEHHKQIRLNRFNDYILDLQLTFKQKQSEGNGKRSMQQRIINLDDDSQVSISGHKKLKTDQRTQPMENMPIISQNAFPQFKNYYQFNNYMFPDPIINSPNGNLQNAKITDQFPQTNYESPQYVSFNYYNSYNDLMCQYYNSQFRANLQTQSNEERNVYSENCYSPEYQQFIAQNCQHQQQHNLYPLSMEPNYAKYGTAHCGYQPALMQTPYLCFNNFNLSIFNW